MLRTPKLSPMVLAELEGTDWELVRGSKHWQLRIDGHLVAILPSGKMNKQFGNRNDLAIRSNVRRHKAQGVQHHEPDRRAHLAP